MNLEDLVDGMQSFMIKKTEPDFDIFLGRKCSVRLQLGCSARKIHKTKNGGVHRGRGGGYKTAYLLFAFGALHIFGIFSGFFAFFVDTPRESGRKFSQ